MPETILVIDDEPDIREILSDILMDESYEVILAESAEQANHLLSQVVPDLVLLDIWMPNKDGMTLLKEWGSQAKINFPIIMISGHGNVETAVESVRLGAYDFIEKPLSTAKLLVSVKRALENNRLLKENFRYKSESNSFNQVIGSSPHADELRRQIEQVAKTDSRVLITGESGCDKRIVARCIHNNSQRKHAPLVEFNLAGLIDDNLSIELFGHEDSSAVSKGKIEQAQNGTLLLDEISDMSLNTQKTLEHVFEQQQFMRTNGKQFLDMNTRIISSTSHNIHSMIEENTFREQLYYYLNVIPIHVHPLRSRITDIPLLIQGYVEYFCQKENLPFRKFTNSAVKTMQSHKWPGNNRELRNVIQRILVFSHDTEVDSDDIHEFINSDTQLIQQKRLATNDLFDYNLRNAREEFEREYLIHHLRNHKGNVASVAKLIGLERTHLYRKLKMLGIDVKLILS